METLYDRRQKDQDWKIMQQNSHGAFCSFFYRYLCYAYMNKRFFITSVVIIAILFAICSITSHILLKDYKPE